MNCTYYVMRTYSYTDRQRLWKVMTRPTFDRPTAEGEMEAFKAEAGASKHRFFIVSMEVE